MDNVEVVRRAYEALASEGVEATLPYLSPEVVIYPFPEWMEDPVYHGHEGFRRLLAGWVEGFDQYSPEVEELRAIGEDVVVGLGYNTGRIRGSNLPVRQPVGAVHRLEGGLAVEIHYFMTWEEALEAAGTSP